MLVKRWYKTTLPVRGQSINLDPETKNVMIYSADELPGQPTGRKNSLKGSLGERRGKTNHSAFQTLNGGYTGTRTWGREKM